VKLDIVLVDCIVLLYELFALKTRRVPTLTQMSSHRYLWPIPFGWLMWHERHFEEERRNG
jgi:hypothetical protein